MADLRRRAVVIPAACALLVGGGAVAWASNGTSSAGYRTATVTKGDVDQLLNLVGTVDVVNQAKVRFRTAGTVSAVTVTVGQAVAKGQVLATMDTGALQDAVTKAEAALAKAKATLETDSTSTSSSSSSSASSSSSSPQRGSQGSGTQAAQQAAERALQQAQRALDAATKACATTSTPTSAPTPSATPSATATVSPSETPTEAALRGPSSPTGGPTTGSLSCSDALTASLHAQQDAAKAQQQLAKALASSSSSTNNSSSSSASSNNASSNSASASSDRGSQGGGGGNSTTSTAAKITLDTAAVSAAQVALTEAQKNLAAVSLVAPIAGTVATVPWTTGGTASASDALVVLGSGPVDVTVDVPSSSIRSIRAGLDATVRADGGTKKLDGQVTRVGLLPTSSSSGSSTSSTTTYPVVVRVPAGAGLVDGSGANVSIVLSTVKDVLTVPNSAVHSTTVDVLSQGKVTSVRIGKGAVGALTTQVTSGLTEGQTVVLADLSEALPTSSTTSSRNGNQFGGGFTGGPPGGFSVGGPTVVRRN